MKFWRKKLGKKTHRGNELSSPPVKFKENRRIFRHGKIIFIKLLLLLLLLYYVFYLRFSKHVLSAQRISIINEKVLCAWFSSFVSSLLDSFHLLFPFVFVSSIFSYYRYVSCFITAPIRLLMIHAEYLCDHNYVVNCGIIVNFLNVFFFFYIILWGFDCLRSNSSQCYFTLLMSRVISVTYEWINWIHYVFC